MQTSINGKVYGRSPTAMLYVCAHVWRSEDILWKWVFFLQSCGFWGQNTNCQVWQQVPLPTKPSCWPLSSILQIIFNTFKIFINLRPNFTNLLEISRHMIFHTVYLEPHSDSNTLQYMLLTTGKAGTLVYVHSFSLEHLSSA